MNNNNIPCLCGHSEFSHTKFASNEFPIPCPSKCNECIFIGKVAEGVFHEYRGDNLAYLEYMSKRKDNESMA